MAIKNNRLTSDQYQENFSDIHPPFETKDAAILEANRCLFCYDAPCMKSCPTSIDVPKFIKQIATENTKGSAHTILSSNILGAGCSKVCPVEKLCEGACVYNLMHEKPIRIANLQRYSTEMALEQKWKLFERKKPLGKKVAIIGAGPAGLSCAHSLSREGVDITIFEKEDKAGGLMTYGIAAYKVTPEFCAEEVDYITSLGGIDIRYNQELGNHFTLEELSNDFDAVYLAFGVGLTRTLGIQGEELEGVVDAISFIYEIRSNEYPSISVGDKVVVIGMGMTAIDAATQAKRLGANDVTLVYRRTENEMPCTKHELDIARLDGCKVIWSAAPKKILGHNGNVSHLVCDVMKQVPQDHSDTLKLVSTGETITVETDMLIKATGQLPYEQLVESIQLVHKGGKITTVGTSATNKTHIFAGGDCVNGGREVVDAVQAGKDGAAQILKYILT